MTRRKSIALIGSLVLLIAGFFFFGARVQNASIEVNAEPQTDASSSLSRGRSLLKQGHADQALGYLENALKLFTQSNSRRGVAASEDALGDLYLIQGQYKVALDHYQKAYEAFVAAGSKDETNQAAASSVASR